MKVIITDSNLNTIEMNVSFEHEVKECVEEFMKIYDTDSTGVTIAMNSNGFTLAALDIVENIVYYLYKKLIKVEKVEVI